MLAIREGSSSTYIDLKYKQEKTKRIRERILWRFIYGSHEKGTTRYETLTKITRRPTAERRGKFKHKGACDQLHVSEHTHALA